MTLTEAERRSPVGLLWAAVAMVAFSLIDVIVKFLSGDYALYQLMFIRSLTGVLIVALIPAPLTGAPLRTGRLRLHIIRALCVVAANFFFFLGLAALPLADATAIFFISPLLISVFSVLFLGESVGPTRWAAIFVGLVGVCIILRPGTAAFQIAALLPLASAFGYAMLHILTRKIGDTESA
ncbi:MAG: DMT family transporter, partial [Pseudomonadota bacterium]